MSQPVNVVRLSPRTIVFALVTVAGLLVVIHLGLATVAAVTGHDYLYGLVWLFDLDRENNVPSFFSGFLFLLNAALFWLVDRTGRRPVRRAALVLAVVFVFLSYDELFSVHEQLTRPLHDRLHTTGIFYYAWILVYLGPLLALTIWFVPSWRGFDRQTRKELAVTAIVYLCGAVVMEMLGGAYDEAFGKHPPLVWGLLVAVEESLEMAGLILLARTLLRLLGPAAGGRAVLFEQAD